MKWMCHLVMGLLLSMGAFGHELDKEQLTQALRKRHHFTHQLSVIEQQAAQSAQLLAATKAKIKRNGDRQHQLKSKLKHLKATYDQQRQILEKQLRASHNWLRQPLAKLLLSDHDHSEINRLLTYQRYWSDHIKTRLEHIHQIQQQLQATNNMLIAREHQLKALQVKQHRQLLALLSEEKSRQALINGLDEKIDDIRAAFRDENQRVIEQANQNQPDEEPVENKQAFLAHSLPWPTEGRLMFGFGSHLQQTSWQRHGISIAATSGQAVRAVAAGEVIFARWLPNYGLLMIINHHNGYLTLYAHNQYLVKKDHDWVRAGEKIAAVGNTGGYLRPQLYFEVRHQSRPENPLHWLTKR